MNEAVTVNGATEKIYPAPFRFLTNGDGTADSPGVRIKSRFILIPNEFESDLDDLIIKSGGDVLGDFPSEADAEYAVTLLDERYYLKYSTKNCDLPHDTFSSVFVGDAMKSARNKLPLPDLNKYRLTPSKYSSYDANQILLQQIKWSDLIPLDKPPSCKITARKVISHYIETSSSLKTHYQVMKILEKNKTVNEKNIPVASADVSEIVHRKQKSAKREERKQCTSNSSTKSNGTAEKIIEDDGASSNRNNTTKSPPSPVQRTQKQLMPDIEKSTDDSTTREEAPSISPETIQPNDQLSPGRVHQTQRSPSPETGYEGDLLAIDKDGAEELPDPNKPLSDQTDQAVDQPSPGRVHQSQRLQSPETGNEGVLLANNKNGAKELPDPNKPTSASDQTDQAVLVQLNHKVTPRKRKRESNINLLRNENC